MYCCALACDFDGTGAADGRLAPEVEAALGRARAQGIVTLLVTGRVLEDVQALCADLSMFDAVVAENGAVVCLTTPRRTIQLGQPPPQQFLGELRRRGVPFHAGAVVIGTWDSHAADVLQLIRQFAIDAQLIFNRGAMMLLPSGINKAVGTRRALEELGRSARNLIAFGDAENDLPLLAMAEVGVAARGAVEAVAAQADERLRHPGGAGVAHYVHRLLEGGATVPTPPRHTLTLGADAAGVPVCLPASGINVMISGDPRSGKSWLAGLVAEQLLERGYRLCVIDPEGDYLALGQRARVLLLGRELALPPPDVVARVLRDQAISLVLNLTTLAQNAQGQYVGAVLGELERSAAASGVPHWVLIDEAQDFFPRALNGSPRFANGANYLLTTYRPSLIADAVYASVQAHLITRTAIEEERYFITSLLRAKGPADLNAADALAGIDLPRAGLLLAGPEAASWRPFSPGARVTAHVHHARKYADTLLPESKAFRFLHATPPAVVRNVGEFHSAVQQVPLASLHHHLTNGDFSRWAADILGDQQLARGLRKLERAAQAGAAPDRNEILAHIEDRYLIGRDPHDGAAG